MSLNLSLRQKLIAVVLVVVLGFGAMGLYAIQSLNSMTAASERVSQLGQNAQTVSSLEVQLLKFAKQRDSASSENIAEIDSTIIGLKQTAVAQLAGVKNQLQDPKAKALLADAEAALTPYLNQLADWVALRKSLGLNTKSGALGQAEKTAAALMSEIEVFGSFGARLREVRAAEKDFMIYPDDAHKTVTLNILKQLRTDIQAMAFDDIFFPFVDKYETALKEVINLRQSMALLDQQLTQSREQVSKHIQSSADYLQSNLLNAAQANAKAAAEAARWSIMLGSLVLAAVIGLIVSSVALSITRNMNRTIAALNEIAAGNLTSKMDLRADRNDEFTQLARATNTMTDGLHDVISHLVQSNAELKQTADAMDLSVQQIAQGSQLISDKSSSLVAATEEISATADQVAETTQHVSDSAQAAFNTAHQGAKVISQAIQALADVAEVVEDTSQSVEQLGSRSKEIDMVIDLIVGVAEQTNLLALNAAIEAARAGEAGRGFAVVADEVRTLASQTVKATSEITDKVEAIQKDTRQLIDAMSRSKERVEQGRMLGDQAVVAVREIEQQTRDAAGQTQEIMAAVKEVAQTTAQMARDMDGISAEINQNHQATSSILSASQAVHKRAEQLEVLIKRFRT
ncbi:methyl-accepting chemotaxis protein [Oceanospirillum multiglobuliferum]|uniref:Methyl-accepting chemotaxis protein n=1 Tax=Oceanospirillum multiglobuliferum TaxID=64969 RepID=A0A1T4QP10_9GAMM|nr:HAMP domain-containing methyl-accepting chemotaxis protein [Oceanospirillum multiglobuliferum]OPX56467.1 hypothetical protein BTE48_03300 [Oceanospirillum multiglobuliferum]SKA05500.1 methyl-accepting chemotaxis protein [Oceanospirillum multiglobuliferum]